MYYVSYTKYIKIPLELLVSFNYHGCIGKAWNKFENIYRNYKIFSANKCVFRRISHEYSNNVYINLLSGLCLQ